MMTVIDGNGLIFGRLASKVAKELLGSKEIVIVNAERIVMSGKPEYLINRYVTKRSLQNKGCPEHSPRWPRVPNLLVRRMLRGMLPWKKPRGRAALKRLKVYNGIPASVKEAPIVYNECRPRNISKQMTVGELCKMIGYQG